MATDFSSAEKSLLEMIILWRIDFLDNFAIRLSWNLQMIGTNFRMNEYFKPYEINVLSELFDYNDYILKELKKSEGEGFGFLSKLIIYENIDYRSDSKSNVVRLNNEKSFWVNDSWNVFETALWDYLSDFRTVFSLYKYHNNEIYIERIKRIAYLDLMSRIHLDMMKIDLSLMIHCCWKGEDIQLENSIIEYYDWVHEVITNRDFTILLNDHNQIEVRLSNYGNRFSNSKIGVLVGKINDWIRELFFSDTLTEQLIGDTVALIESKFNEIPKLLGEVYVEKMKFIKRLNRVHKLSISRNELFYLYVSTTAYQSNKAMLFNRIVDNNVYNINSIPSIDYYDFEVRFRKLAKFFEDTDCIKGRTTIGKKVLSKYKNTDDGCFSIMEEMNGKKYFAFSGIKEHMNYTTSSQYEDLAHKIMNEVLNVSLTIPIEEVRNHNYEFNWAYLTGGTMRHTQFMNNNTNVEYISSPIKLENDVEILDWEAQKSSIGTTYACCERKIMTFSENNSNKLFFVRWAPCKKCLPALISNVCDISVQALGLDFNNWVNNGRSEELRRYIIKQKFSVHEVV